MAPYSTDVIRRRFDTAKNCFGNANRKPCFVCRNEGCGPARRSRKKHLQLVAINQGTERFLTNVINVIEDNAKHDFELVVELKEMKVPAHCSEDASNNLKDNDTSEGSKLK